MTVPCDRVSSATIVIGFVLDEIFVNHRAPAGHPERPARVEAVNDALAAAGIRQSATHIAARPATDEELHRVHTAAYLEALRKAVPGKQGWLDPDTYFSPGTWDATLAAAGGVSALATAVLAGELERGLAVVRPPGHHATADRAMGFCLVNNVAVAAAAARAAGATRVAIVDWDVHHGNGTQDIFWDDPNVLFTSVHQYPFYPGTGAPTEIGGDAARGATVNVGLPAGSGDPEYAMTFDRVILPAVTAFAPDLILLSAGFDAFEDDPLAGMRVTRRGFAALAARMRRLADTVAGGRLVVTLEGGYDLLGLAGGMTEVLASLVGPTPDAPAPRPHGPVALASVAAVAEAAVNGTLAAHAGVAGSPLAAAETDP
jgi:acetoin utilization deacetylase AcuC-like enzyme